MVLLRDGKRLNHRNSELAEFLKSHRASLSPEGLGLPRGNRRRTKGLRREEIAAFAGVGLTWYTWLEQGRDIAVSANFLNRLSKLFCLNSLETEHLFILAQNRLPAEEGATSSVIPPIIEDLMNELSLRPCYVWNLNWDIIGWNHAADVLFKFSAYQKNELNFIWLLFTKSHMQNLMLEWARQAEDILSSFRRDYARNADSADRRIFINSLKNKSNEFARLWKKQGAYAPCDGVRDMKIASIGNIRFQHTTLIIQMRNHLKLSYYQPITNTDRFNRWVIANSRISED